MIEEIVTKDDEFEYMGIRYDISLVVKRDKELIYQEADRTHSGVLDDLYIRESLSPSRVKLYVDQNSTILYIMVVYLISYKDGKCQRMACGDYYPIGIGGYKVYPHPYQARICW